MRKLAIVLLSGLVAQAAAAGDDGAAVLSVKLLKPDYALKLIRGAMTHCRKKGAQVGVAVVDRSGLLQGFLRDRFAGAHTVETARRKAWTAVSFRTDTHELDRIVQPGHESFGIRWIPQALPVGGGVMIEAAGALIGAVGVSGAPTPAMDVECAKAGIAAIEDDLGF